MAKNLLKRYNNYNNFKLDKCNLKNKMVTIIGNNNSVVYEYFIPSNYTIAGDLCVLLNDSILFISLCNIDKISSYNYSFIGVVTVPGIHDVYGDGSCGIISLHEMSCDTPINGSTSSYTMCLGEAEEYSELKTYGNVILTNNSENETLSGAEYGFLATNKTSNTFSANTISCYSDSNSHYNSGASGYTIPSPYLSDDTRNKVYYDTTTISLNALSDLNGRKNSDILLSLRGEKDYYTWKPTSGTATDYPAVSCCDMYYVEGTEQGDWYLPSIGEWGYAMARWDEINESIKYCGGVELDEVFYWSSTEDTEIWMAIINTKVTSVIDRKKTASACARAFMKIKNI